VSGFVKNAQFVFANKKDLAQAIFGNLIIYYLKGS